MKTKLIVTVWSVLSSALLAGCGVTSLEGAYDCGSVKWTFKKDTVHSSDVDSDFPYKIKDGYVFVQISPTEANPYLKINSKGELSQNFDGVGLNMKESICTKVAGSGAR